MDTTTTSMADLAKEICGLLAHCTDEAKTKEWVIRPVFRAWGWHGPGQLVPEESLSLPGSSPTKCDYAFMVGGKQAVLIEAKKHRTNLDSEFRQLYRYFGPSDARLAILTDGQMWRFYSDLVEVNKLDHNPFRVIDMCDLREGDEEFLHAFRREGFDVAAIRARAEDERDDALLDGWLEALSVRPSDALVRDAMKNLGYDGSGKKVEREKVRAGVARAFVRFRGATLAIDEERADVTGSEYHPPSRPDTPPSVPGTGSGKPAGRAKATKPDGFRLWGKYYPAKKWNDVWYGVAEALYDRHPDQFRDMVGRPRGKRSYVEVDRQMLNSAYRVRDSQYWVGGGANSKALQERCRNLLELLGYARSDIEFLPPAE